MPERRIGNRTVELSSLDRVLFPGEGITKGDLVRYYERIAPVMLPHLRGRPLATNHYPQGIDKPGFIQQNVRPHYPDWIGRVTVPNEEDETVHPVAEDAATLVYLANQNAVTIHIWQSRVGHLRQPDRFVIDLDPTVPDFAALREAARALRGLLDELGLAAYLMTTGSRGLHVTVPILPELDCDEVLIVTQQLAAVAAARYPDALTDAPRKKQRGDRIYVDVMRNAYAQLAVAPYAVRARPGAPVATPLDWGELGRGGLTAQSYTLRNMFRRLGRRDDPWARFDADARSLLPVCDRLAPMLPKRSP